MAGKISAKLGKDRFENPAGGKHRRAGIDGNAIAIDGAQLAAGGCHAFHHCHRHAASRKQRSGTQPADAGADDDHAPAGMLAGMMARRTQNLSPKPDVSTANRPIITLP